MEILYPIADLTEERLNNLKMILEVVSKQFTVCFSDVGSKSSYNSLKGITRHFDYCYEKGEWPFNKSRALNNGVKNLIKEKWFVGSDVDIMLLSDNFVDNLQFDKKLTCFPILAVDYKAHPLPVTKALQEQFLLTKDFNLLVTKKGIEVIYGGLFLSETKYFLDNLYDENYIGWGAENKDFEMRAYFNNELYKLGFSRSSHLNSIHLYHSIERRNKEMDYSKKNSQYLRSKFPNISKEAVEYCGLGKSWQ